MQDKLFPAVLLFLLVGAFSSAVLGQTGGSTLDLNGTWTNNDGEEVEIQHLLRSGAVIATFSSIPKGLSNPGDCPGGGHRPKYVDGHLAGYSLTGTMWRCTVSKPLMDDCGLAPVYTTTFKTTLVSNNLIKGTRRTEYYGPAKSNGPCKYTRDASGDKDVDFSLTRKGLDCPDTAEIEKYNEITDRAAKFTELAAKYVKDGEIGSALDRSQKALRNISNTLSVLVKTGKKCKEIHESLSEIEQFEAAIDQINNAGCDSQALAGGFDNLFQAAGKIGKRFVKIPELQPLFEILSENSNFFQKVSGALDPEHRWADQFAGIDGYVPNCAQ